MTDTSQPPSKKEKPPSLIETVFPTRANAVFFTAIALGVAMILLSFGVLFLLPDSRLQSNLILCVGLAVLVAALGSQATVQIGRVVVAGAAAIAIALFLIIEDKIDELMEAQIALGKGSYVHGKIRKADPEKFLGLTMDADIEFLGNLYPRGPSGNVYRFVLIGDLPDGQTLNLWLDDGGENHKDFVVHRSCLTKIPGDVRSVEWEMRKTTIDDAGERIEVPAIVDLIENATIAVHGDPSRTKGCKSVKGGLASAKPSIFARAVGVSRALAAFYSKKRPPSQGDLEQALTDLTDRNTTVRRNARSVLSLAPVSFVPSILAAMRSTGPRHRDKYRLVLGGTVALTLMLRRNASLAATIGRRLGDADMKLLLDAAAHPDRTMRNFATEFLSKLADPKVTERALTMAMETDNERKRYSWLVVAHRGWSRLDRAKKRELHARLARAEPEFGPQSKKLLARFNPN